MRGMRITHNYVPVLRTVLLTLLALTLTTQSFCQGVEEEKTSVGFIFGVVHPHNPDGSAVKDLTTGRDLAITVPLGTAFFVFYPDSRSGPDNGFVYLVTNKHVLKDTDGSFLKSVSLRM